MVIPLYIISGEIAKKKKGSAATQQDIEKDDPLSYNLLPPCFCLTIFCVMIFWLCVFPSFFALETAKAVPPYQGEVSTEKACLRAWVVDEEGGLAPCAMVF